MIGDLILWIRIVFKQQTCIHNYKTIIRKDTWGDFKGCIKCDKIK